jgi:hypothetical protein
MSQTISERTAIALRSSISTVEAFKLPIIEEMTASLAAADPRRGRQWAEVAAESLVSMLIDQAHSLITAGIPRDLRSVRREHRRKSINGPHYSRFGDALAAVMIDAAGAALPRNIGGAWCDTFWAVIARLRSQDGRPIAQPRDRSGTDSPVTMAKAVV